MLLLLFFSFDAIALRPGFFPPPFLSFPWTSMPLSLTLLAVCLTHASRPLPLRRYPSLYLYLEGATFQPKTPHAVQDSAFLFLSFFLSFFLLSSFFFLLSSFFFLSFFSVPRCFCVPCPLDDAVRKKEYPTSICKQPATQAHESHSLTHSPTHSLTHALTHSLTHSLTHARTHSLTVSHTHSQSRCFNTKTRIHPKATKRK